MSELPRLFSLYAEFKKIREEEKKTIPDFPRNEYEKSIQNKARDLISEMSQILDKDDRILQATGLPHRIVRNPSDARPHHV